MVANPGRNEEGRGPWLATGGGRDGTRGSGLFFCSPRKQKPGSAKAAPSKEKHLARRMVLWELPCVGLWKTRFRRGCTHVEASIIQACLVAAVQVEDRQVHQGSRRPLLARALRKWLFENQKLRAGPQVVLLLNSLLLGILSGLNRTKLSVSGTSRSTSPGPARPS